MEAATSIPLEICRTHKRAPSERALAQCESLMDQRPTFLDHRLVLVSIDHAIRNVFEPQNRDEVGNYITKIRELMDFVQKMNGLGVGTTGIELPLPDLHLWGTTAVPEIQCQIQNIDIRRRLAVLAWKLDCDGHDENGVRNTRSPYLLYPDPARCDSPRLKIMDLRKVHFPDTELRRLFKLFPFITTVDRGVPQDENSWNFHNFIPLPEGLIAQACAPLRDGMKNLWLRGGPVPLMVDLIRAQ